MTFKDVLYALGNLLRACSILLLIVAVCLLFLYSQPKEQSKPQRIETLNGGKIESTIAYPEQGRYYVKVRGDNGMLETWEVSKGYFDRVILGAPINRRDNL